MKPAQILPALAIAGVIGTAGALVVDPHAALAAYLTAVVAATAVPVGALAVLMVSYLVRGQWTDGLHVPLAAAARTIPVAGLLFVPVLAGMPWLYPWLHARPEGAFKAIYLTPWFFVLRSFAYFAIWTAIAWWTRRVWGDKAQMTRAASAGLIVYALTASLAAVDWIESLTPDFHSSIFGLLLLSFQVLAGLSFGVAFAAATRVRSGALAGYGQLLLAMLLLWAYLHAMQYLVIWAGNIPREAVWYLRRESGVWGYVLWGLVFLQFVIPFCAMLSSRVRSRPRPLLLIAGGTLALRFAEAALLVLPAADADGGVLWLAIPAAAAAAIGILGLSLQITLARMERSAEPQALPAATSA